MVNRRTVAEYYSGKNIFVTGPSGFIGKVLLWKLLNNCPNLNTIYVLIRPKREKNVQTRVEELLQCPIFDKFREEKPHLLRKIHPISGDIAEDDLGISEQNAHILMDNVHVIFHIAAILKLDAKLKDAVNMNTLATLRLLQLATKMPKLEVFVHTSTAYCHCDVQLMEEKTYEANESPYDVIELVRWMKADLLDSMTEKLIKPHPNTYTYSKRLAELVVADFYPKLPVAIARPSIVIPGWREPIPGWVDNLNGPIGIMTAAGKGIVRTMWCKGEYDADMIPVDLVCNSLVVLGWKIGTEQSRPEQIPVYNIAQMEIEPTTWRQVVDLGKSLQEVYPFELMLWYPGGDIHSNLYVHKVLAFFFHWIPAYCIDFLLHIFGYRQFLVHTQKKIHHGQKVLQYFTTRQWRFVKSNFMSLKELLNKEDKETFILTAKGLNKEEYMKNSILITRNYVMKENPDNIQRCRTRLRMFYYLDRLVKIIFYFLVTWTLLRIVDFVFDFNISDQLFLI